MALEQAQLFIERLKTDEAFKARIMAVEDVAERLKLAKADGYDFTEEEIKTAAAELSETDVKNIEGGLDNCPAQFCTRRCVVQFGGKF